MLPSRGTALAALSLLILAPALAGCVADTVNPALASASLPDPLALAFEAHECDEAGAVTLNPTLGFNDGILPEPWEAADTTPYSGVPMEAGNVGVYHAAFACHEWTVNGDTSNHPSGGFVGMIVKDPGFPGVSAVDHNVLVATFVTRDKELRKVLDAAGWYVYDGLGHVNGMDTPTGWAVQSILNTAGDGIYESDLVLSEGEPIETLRLWFIVDGADDLLHPAYLDFHQEGGKRWLGQGYFSHTLNADHPGGAAASAVGGLGFTGVARTATFHVVPDVVLEEMWDH